MVKGAQDQVAPKLELPEVLSTLPPNLLATALSAQHHDINVKQGCICYITCCKRTGHLHLPLLRFDGTARAIYVDNPPRWIDGVEFTHLVSRKTSLSWMQVCSVYVLGKVTSVAVAMRLFGRQLLQEKILKELRVMPVKWREASGYAEGPGGPWLPLTDAARGTCVGFSNVPRECDVKAPGYKGKAPASRKYRAMSSITAAANDQA